MCWHSLRRLIGALESLPGGCSKHYECAVGVSCDHMHSSWTPTILTPVNEVAAFLALLIAYVDEVLRDHISLERSWVEVVIVC